MKTSVIALMFLAVTARAETAYYGTLGITGPSGARSPGVMVVIGEDSLCRALHDELQTTLTHDWLKSARAFAVVRSENNYPAGGVYEVHPGLFSAPSTPATCASVYDVRVDEKGELDFKHRAVEGSVSLGDGDVLTQEDLPISLNVNLDAGGPQVPRVVTAKYCPALAALAQLWSKPD